MDAFKVFASRLAGLFRKSQRERELDDELRSHLEMLTAENVKKGMPTDEARYATLRAFGGVEQAKENYRDQRGLPSLESIVQDVRHSLRQLRRSPGFAVIAILTMALGIGANTAIFSLIDGTLLRPLPGIANPNQLVSMYRMQKNDPYDVMGYPDYVDYRDRSRSFDGIAAEVGAAMNFGHGTPERLIGGCVTGNFFATLGVGIEQGRLISLADDAPLGAHPVVVLSYDLWRKSFGASPDAIGSRVELNSFPFTVIGVATRDFHGASIYTNYDFWVPLSMMDQSMPRYVGHHFFEERAWGWLNVFGRLKPGIPIEQAQAEVSTIAQQLAQAYPNTNAGRTVALVRGVGLDPDDRADLRGFLGLLLGGVTLLLIITCANVEGLLLVRATGRQREIALREALGATRGRLVRQLLTEGLLLSLAGGLLGLLLAPGALRLAIPWMQPDSVLRHAGLGLDIRILAFTLVASVATGIGCALLPAFRTSSPNLLKSLVQGSAGIGHRRLTIHRLLAAAQVAVCCILLIGAVLLARSMQKVLTADPGFETRNVLLATVDTSLQGYSQAQSEAFFQQALERLSHTPGVQAASMAVTVPPEDFSGGVSVFHPGEEPSQEVLRGHEFQLGLRVNIDTVGPHYLQTMGIPLLEGRDFSEQDGEGTLSRDSDGNMAPEANRPNGSGVVIVNRKLADMMWPGQNAMGKYLSWPSIVGPPRPPLLVIGVTANSRYRSLVNDPPPLMYVPMPESFTPRARLILRTASRPAALADTLRAEIASLDKNLPVFQVETMQEHMAPSLWQQRMATAMIGFFGMLALLLATLGLYGVVAYSVAQRTREIGIRMALGAERVDVLREVIGQGLWLMAAGVGAGVLGALGLTRFLATLLYGVQPHDPLTFGAVAILLAGVALVASYIPARRAARVDPMVALRYE